MINNNSLYLDPISGGYLLANNSVVSVNSTISKINLLLKQPIGGNIYDLSNGNPLLTTTGILSTTEVTNGINFCLQPLISSGEISSLTIVDISYPPPYAKLVVNMTITLPSGINIPVNWIR